MGDRKLRCGVVGYGGAFNMGFHHLGSMKKNPEMEPAAVCELDPARLAVAAKDYPGIATFTDVDEMLAKASLDLVTIITPHNSHAPLALKCLEAGVNTITEKPMCISAADAGRMVSTARRKKRMVSVFHNRRWDGDFMTLRQIIRDGWIGRPFRLEAGFLHWGRQGKWWRADKKISGGSIYDWGAHFTDWILDLIPQKLDWVIGNQVKHPEWKEYTNEDHSEYTLRFQDGTLATLNMSNMAAEGKPRWWIVGDAGSIVDGGDRFKVKTSVRGRTAGFEVPFGKGDGDAYYRNVAAHLARREPLVITGESAARVIGVLDAANKSARQGARPVKPAFA